MRPEALLQALALKDVARAGWVRRGIPRPESVAAHSWGLSLLTLALLPPGLDLGRALAYAALHDLAEATVGDLTPHDGVDGAEKHRREAAAIETLLADRPELRARWHAYEARLDDEARFVHQLDRLDMALQAARYAAAHGRDLTEFLDSADRAIHAPALRDVLAAARAAHDAAQPGGHAMARPPSR